MGTLQRVALGLDQDVHRHRLCAAIIDRPTFGCSIIETGTTSYRLAHTLAQEAG